MRQEAQLVLVKGTVLRTFAHVETCFSRVPLPPGAPGEGGAKRRVRAGMDKRLANLPSSGASRHLLPEGEGLARKWSGANCSARRGQANAYI